MITLQAQKIRDELSALGLRWRSDRRAGCYKDFGVRTHGDGLHGFGHAYAILYSKRANAVVAENARALATNGLRVTLYTRGDELVHASVVNGYPYGSGVDFVDIAEER